MNFLLNLLRKRLCVLREFCFLNPALPKRSAKYVPEPTPCAAYVDVFTLPVRRYVYQLLKALQVDLIFIEDGVGYRKLFRVLKVLFEVYDKGAGQKRSEDVHFRGLTKVRVMFHDFDVDEPFRSNKYPEPKFAPLGRLRVLHIFRDRGGEEEFVEPPYSFDETPVPNLVGV